MRHMETFFNASLKEKIQGVFEDAEEIRDYSARWVNILHDQICYLLRHQNLELMKLKMQHECARDRLESFKEKRRQLWNRREHTGHQDVYDGIHRSSEEAKRIQQEKDRCLERIDKLQGLEERVYPFKVWAEHGPLGYDPLA